MSFWVTYSLAYVLPKGKCDDLLSDSLDKAFDTIDLLKEAQEEL